MLLSVARSVPKNCKFPKDYRNKMHFPVCRKVHFSLPVGVQVCQNLTRDNYFGTMSDSVVNNFVIFLMVLQ